MAKPSLPLITALRATADRIESGARFHWNHMGSCNCGHLAQTLTQIEPKKLHQMALANAGDWSEQARDYCPDSGYPLDRIIEIMVGAGLNTVDIANLERLSDTEVLTRMGYKSCDNPPDFRTREDAVSYMRAWADVLETKWRKGMEDLGGKPATQTNAELV